MTTNTSNAGAKNKQENKHTSQKTKPMAESSSGYSQDLINYFSKPKEERLKDAPLKLQAIQAARTKNEAKRSPEQKELVKNTNNMLMAELHKSIEIAERANPYLFRLIQRVGLTEGLRNNRYMATVTKKDDNGIECTLKGDNGYKRTKLIDNQDILKLERPRADRHKKEISKEERGFLQQEIKYHDSCVFEVAFATKKDENNKEIKILDKKEIKIIAPEKIIEGVETYVNANEGSASDRKKMSEMIGFASKGSNEHAQGYVGNAKRKAREEHKSINADIQHNANELPQPPAKLPAHAEYLRNMMINFFSDPQIPIYIHKGGDIDNQAALLLLRLCPRYKRNRRVITINPGDEKNIKTGIFLDIGETENGIYVEGKKLILSEHKKHTEGNKMAKRPNSTTHMLHNMFKEAYLLPVGYLKQIERFIDFVDKVDGFNYQIGAIDYKNSHTTMRGLHKTLVINDGMDAVYNWFENPKHTGFEILSEKDLAETKVEIIDKKNKGTDQTEKKTKIVTLREISEKREQETKDNVQLLEKLKTEGYELMYKGTPFIVDIEKDLQKSLKDGPQVTGANTNEEGKNYPYGFFTIYAQRGNIYIYSPKKFPVEVGGFPTDGHFLNIHNPSDEDLDRLFKAFDMDHRSKPGIRDEIKARRKRVRDGIHKREAKAAAKLEQEKGQNTNNTEKISEKSTI